MAKKNTLIFLAVVLFFTACNFPLSNNQDAEQLIATQVALAQTQTAAIIPSVENKSTPTIHMPDVPTSTGTPAPSQTSTPTPILSDPSSLLGSPTWANSLDNGNAFGIDSTGYDDGYTRIGISNGVMTLQSLTSSGWKGWRLTDRGISDFYLEGSFIQGACSSNDQYGIVFRAPDYSSGLGYYFGINCDGKHFLIRNDSAGSNLLVDKTTNTAYIQGEGQVNRLGVLVKGNVIQLFINGQIVNQVTDSVFTTNSKFGVYIAGMNTTGFSVKLDQINFWNQ